MIILDIVAGGLLLIAGYFLSVRMFFTEAGLGLIGLIFPVILAVLVFTVLYPVRYPAIAIIIGLTAISFLLNQLTYQQPLKRYNKAVFEYYGHTLYEQIKGYPLVDAGLYAEVMSITDDKIDRHLYLFILKDNFDRIFQNRIISSCRWQFIELKAMPCPHRIDSRIIKNQYHEDQLCLALLIDFADGNKTALPFWMGNRSDGSRHFYTHYSWSLCVSHMYVGADLTLYPIETSEIDTLIKYYTQASQYFSDHIAQRPHILLNIPTLTDALLSPYLEQSTLERANKKSKHINKFRASRNHEMREAIEYAIELSEK